IDMEEVKLNEVDQEKQPMTGDGPSPVGETNGSVKLKVPDDDVMFTGLSKEELMKVAGTPGALMGVVAGIPALQVSQLVNVSGVDLVVPDLLSTNVDGVERIKAVDTLHSQQSSVGWGLGASKPEPLSKVATTPDLRHLYQLLLFTLPGTPVFTYGDEIGLLPANRTERSTLRSWFKSLSELRGKERSLLHGDYYPLNSSTSSLAFLRVWDQSERYITVVNWGAKPSKLKLTLPPTEGVILPETAKVRMSRDDDLEVDSSVSLDMITLGPEKAVILQFPFTG
ncbi:hypothetical protein XENOCAPTIV_010082, partial [Xenoophorus captivus]